MNRIKEFYQLIKPGIVYGNSIHVVAGVLFAAATYGFWWRAALGVLFGTALIIASACVVNNIIDRDIDAKMARTKQRALPSQRIRLSTASWYAGLLAGGGFVILALTTNWLTVALGVVAYIFYTIIYTYSKRVTVHSTLIGTIPGALPIVAGYVALGGQFNLTTWLLFFLIVFWQLAHFYAISLFRKDEYAAAAVPVLSLRASERVVSWAIVVGVVLYVATIIALGATKSWSVAATMLALALAGWWLGVVATDHKAKTTTTWARRVFGWSLWLSLLLPVVAFVNLVLR